MLTYNLLAHTVCNLKLSRYSDWLRAGRPGFDSRQEYKIYLCSTLSRPALCHIQPPTQWVWTGSFPWGKAARA
jgi:hypothetical protein